MKVEVALMPRPTNQPEILRSLRSKSGLPDLFGKAEPSPDRSRTGLGCTNDTRMRATRLPRQRNKTPCRFFQQGALNELTKRRNRRLRGTSASSQRLLSQ